MLNPAVRPAAEMLDRIRTIRIGPWAHNPWTVEAGCFGAL